MEEAEALVDSTGYDEIALCRSPRPTTPRYATRAGRLSGVQDRICFIHRATRRASPLREIRGRRADSLSRPRPGLSGCATSSTNVTRDLFSAVEEAFDAGGGVKLYFMIGLRRDDEDLRGIARLRDACHADLGGK